MERLGNDIVSKLSLAFHRARGNEPMNRDVFRDCVIGEAFPYMPYLLWTQLYRFLDVDNSNEISVKYFICLVAILLKGTVKERMKLCFCVFNTTASGVLTRDELQSFLPMLMDDSVAAIRDDRSLSATEFLAQLFPKLDSTLRSDEFRRALHPFSYVCLFTWIDALGQRLKTILTVENDQSLAVSIPTDSESEDGTFHQHEPIRIDNGTRINLDPIEQFAFPLLLEQKTLNETELQLFRNKFYDLRVQFGGSFAKLETIASVLCPDIFPQETLTRVYQLFYPRPTLRQVVMGLVCTCVSSWKDILSYYFVLFTAVPGEDQLARKELIDLILFTYPNRSSQHEMLAYKDAKKLADAALTFQSVVEQSSISHASANDTASTMHLTAEQYMQWITIRPEALAFIKHVRCCVHVRLGSRPTSHLDERHFIGSICDLYKEKSPGCPGTTWCLIEARWWREWRTHVQVECNQESSPCIFCRRVRQVSGQNDKLVSEFEISSIQNSRLLVNNRLNVNLIYQTHYVLVNYMTWIALSSWYGGSPKLARHVIDSDGIVEMELYPLVLDVYYNDIIKSVSLSKMASVRDLKLAVCDAVDASLDVGRVAFWHQHPEDDSTSWEPVKAHDSETLLSIQLIDGHHILIDSDGTWRPSGYQPEKDQDASQPLGDATRGTLVGLANLGNTCFMNSALQCIVHTPLLSEYFLTGEYLNDINLNSPHGMNGLLAIAFGDLIKELLQPSKRRAIAPRRFKQAIGKFHPPFEGIQQQDSQEFLSVLLNGLNEDLCRLADGKKPYSELPDSDGRPDSVLAREWWINHFQRDPSIITCCLTGQFKSLLTCSTCGIESARFEPFSILQLPLPEQTNITVPCIVYFSKNKTTPVRLHVVIDKTSTVRTFLTQVAAIPQLWSTDGAPDAADLVLAERSEHGIQDGPFHSSVKLMSILQTAREELSIFEFEPLSDPELYYSNLKSTLETTEEHVLVRTDGEIFRPGVITSRISSDRVCIQVRGTREKRKALVAHDLLPLSAPHAIRFIMVHRKSQLVPFYFATPARPVLFSLPYLIRMSSNEITGSKLYHLAEQLMQRMLSLSTPSTTTATTCVSMTTELTFQLCRIKRTGLHCSECKWFRPCTGCVIPSDETKVEVQQDEWISIDWGTELLPRLDPIQSVSVKDHESYDKVPTVDSNQSELTRCLDMFCSEEQLSAYCSNCSSSSGEYKETNQLKTLKLWATPPVLILQLKRFKQSQRSNQLLKLNNLVDFPIETLDVSDYLAKAQNETNNQSQEIDNSISRIETRYDLFGVVNHTGVLGAGHYSSFVLNDENSNWYHIDDIKVERVSPSIISPSRRAYLLFYKRKDVGNLDLDRIFPGPCTNPQPIDPSGLRQKLSGWKKKSSVSQLLDDPVVSSSHSIASEKKCSFM